jgi:Family of unknown function (DUF6349)
MTTTVTRPLAELLTEHERLHAIWKQNGTEEDRRLMAAAWEIGITQPGAEYGRRRPLPDPENGCRPTCLCRHRLPEPGEDYWGMQDHLAYRGACLGCGWVADQEHLIGQGGENAAVEDANDHTHPGWRELPVVKAPPSMESPTTYQRQINRWVQEWGRLLPDGWLERGGPIRTHRTPPGNRHVPGRAPGGGYDLATHQAEMPGGQLGLL